MTSISLAPDGDFLPAVARSVLAVVGTADTPRDLSRASLLLPNIKLGPALTEAFRVVADGAVLLPRIDTLSGFVAPWMDECGALADARRQLILHAVLRGREWFDDSQLWEVVGELIALFDTLTEHAVRLPDDEVDLLARLESGFALRQSQALAFEARVVNTLWRAEAQGRPSRVAARLLAASRWLAACSGPLVVVLESSDAGPLQALLDEAAKRIPVLVLRPDRALAKGALATVLSAAWPLRPGQSMRERAASLQQADVQSARGQLSLLAAESLESLGQGVADQVVDWLQAGKLDIALVACDRLAARRARALLERRGVLVQDETGWKMATTRVAAVVDAWLEVLATDGWHRALLDLLRAPLLFDDVDPVLRGRAVECVQRLLVEKNLGSGLDALLALLRVSTDADAVGALTLVERLIQARSCMQTGQAVRMVDWLRRLESSLETLGAASHFARDAAGLQWLEWLQTRQAELAEDEGRFRFAAWRVWFNRQMDTVLFRDERVESTVVMTHLAATRLRRFDAVIVVGADVEHLAPAGAAGWLTHAGVRRELGLPGLDAGQAQLREDLAGLFLASDACMLAWQSAQRGEEKLPAADVAILRAVLQQVASDDVVVPPRPCGVSADAVVGPTARAAPAMPSSRVPLRLSASGMRALLACPYQYFGRYVLRLAEQEELLEAMEKQDFGTQLHGLLHDFHTRYPVLGAEPDEVLQAALSALTEEAFAVAVARNFQDHAWRLRWKKQIPQYLAWQRQREADGWRWRGGETDLRREQLLSDGQVLSLQGRIDRVDAHAGQVAPVLSVLDYKSKSARSLALQAGDPDDIQLAFYALLIAQDVGQAAYVALDGDEVKAVVQQDAAERADALAAVISESFEALLKGAAMPAQGTESACSHCELRGVCRKEWVT